MKSIKTLALGLMLTFAGVVYAAGNAQQQDHSGHQAKSESCCAAGANCCAAGGDCCKSGADCCKDGASCCAGKTCAMKGSMSAKKTAGDSCCMAKVGQKAKVARRAKVSRKTE